MIQRVFELVAAAADKFFRHGHGDFIRRFDGVAGLAGRMAVDTDLAGENEALGLFAAFAKGAFDEDLIQTGHGQARVPLVRTRFCTSR